MFEQFSSITQQQLILIVGILVILLLLLDAYRRSKRKKYQAQNKPKVDAKAENKDQPKEEEKEVVSEDKIQSENAETPDDSDSTVEYKFDAVEEVKETSEEAINTEEEKLDEPEVPEEDILPEPKTWEEAVEQKRKMQMKANRSSHTDEPTVPEPTSQPSESSLSQGIIALHIMAPRQYVFYGEDLVTVFDHYQLNYNRELQTYQGISSEGEVMFNVTTATKPGTFDHKKINDLQTPGISFFMDISMLSNPKEQFKQMLSLLYKMNEHLGGMLLNETRSRFTQSDVSRITASIKKLENPQEEQ